MLWFPQQLTNHLNRSLPWGQQEGPAHSHTREETGKVESVCRHASAASKVLGSTPRTHSVSKPAWRTGLYRTWDDAESGGQRSFRKTHSFFHTFTQRCLLGPLEVPGTVPSTSAPEDESAKDADPSSVNMLTGRRKRDSTGRKVSAES